MKYNLLDFDQTLFNTRDALIRVYTEAFNTYGYDVNTESFIKNEGASIQNMFNEYNVAEKDRVLIKIYKKDNYKYFFKYIIPNYDLLKLNNKIIVTDANSLDVKKILEYYNIVDVIEVIGRDISSVLKPNPEGFIQAMIKYGLENEYTVYDDSKIGIDAAKSAVKILGNSCKVEIINVTLRSVTLNGGSSALVRLQNSYVDKISKDNYVLLTLYRNDIKTPEIYFLNDDKIIMKYIDGDLLYKKYDNLLHFQKIFDLVKSISKISDNKKYGFNTYIERIFHHKLFYTENEMLTRIFDQTIKWLLEYKSDFELYSSYCHGDLTLNNIIYSGDEFYVIDPNNSKKMYSSWLLDLSKLLQSTRNYEFIFGFSDTDNIYEVQKLRKSIFNNISMKETKLVRLLELTHWLRMLKYKEHHRIHFELCKKNILSIYDDLKIFLEERDLND